MTTKVVTLGPEGTFSEMAVLQHWKEDAKNVKILYAGGFSEIFDLVEQGKVDYGMFPLEDSVEGDVRYPQDPLELLREHNLYIVAEENIFVVHCLLGKKGINDIKVVVSQPQVLLHCQRFLRTHLQGVEQKPVSSTAEGAQIASKDPTFGAIGSERLAKIYSLNILSKEVHDNGINTTRFAVVGLKPITPSDPAKTSLIIYPKVDQPGVLYSILGKFAEKKINLTRIASRPLGRAMGEYVFFIDFEGNLNDPRVRETLEQTKRLGIVESIRVLGSYSKSLPSVGESVVNPLIKEKKIEPFKLMEQTFEFWDNDEDRKYDLL